MVIFDWVVEARSTSIKYFGLSFEIACLRSYLSSNQKSCSTLQFLLNESEILLNESRLEWQLSILKPEHYERDATSELKGGEVRMEPKSNVLSNCCMM